jgi:deazaflavin-dependent oxidoreductase (nitroreductase family)
VKYSIALAIVGLSIPRSSSSCCCVSLSAIRRLSLPPRLVAASYAGWQHDRMPLPQWLARFNRVGTNVVTLPLAGHLPGLAIVVHRGRRSGKLYRTPIDVFRRPGGFVVALTYGPDRDWVKNIMAAGECELVTRGQRVRVGQPRLFKDPQRRHMPPFVRLALSVMGVTDFLDLSRL